MKVAITGSTGLVGTALTQRLRIEGHEVVPITRGDPSNPHAHWDPAANWIRQGAFEGLDAVVNLSGASIGDSRWTASRKRLLYTSRVDLTRFLVAHLGALDAPPKVYVQASGVDYYGPRGDELLNEQSTKGESYLADLVDAWEQEGRRASEYGMRTVMLRAGVVLSDRGGALKKMLLPFKLGIGGRLGSGEQYLSWISLPDVVSVNVYALESELEGVVNATSPNPVTNADFTKALGHAIKRPTLIPVPGFGIKLLYGGELSEELLLTGQRVIPARLQEAGFKFEHPTIDDAFANIFRRRAA